MNTAVTGGPKGGWPTFGPDGKVVKPVECELDPYGLAPCEDCPVK